MWQTKAPVPRKKPPLFQQLFQEILLLRAVQKQPDEEVVVEEPEPFSTVIGAAE
jgi:hypothetical protein